MVFAVPVELPAVSHKRLPVYVLANNFSRQLDVSFVADGQALASTKVAVNPQVNLSYFAGLVAPERGALSLIDATALPGMTRPKVLVDLPLQDLPERYQALRSFDLLVLNGVDTSTFTPEQIAALETWVNQGGRLVVGGGASAARTLSGLPASLLPFIFERIEELGSLSSLEDFIAGDGAEPRPVRVPGPFPVAVGEAQDGRVLAEQDGAPLVLEWRIGNGYVNFVALDLNASPFDAWNGTIPFWERLLAPNSAYPDWMPVDVSARQQLAGNMPYTLTNLPMLDLPSARGLAALLGLYILLVGPVNYFLLRWQKRLHLAWVTIPTVTLIFSAAAFGLGYALHGTDLFLNKIAIIQPEASGKARVDSFVGLFSPAQSAYELEVQGGGLLSPLSPYYDPWNSMSPSPGATSTSVAVSSEAASSNHSVRYLAKSQSSSKNLTRYVAALRSSMLYAPLASVVASVT